MTTGDPIIAGKNDGFFNVATYGATGSGGADDSSAIQATIDAAEAAGGGLVFFPPGRYDLSTGLTVNASITFQGSGTGGSASNAATTIDLNTASDDMFDVGTTAPVTFRDMYLNCATTQSTGYAAIKVAPGATNSSSRFEHVTIAGFNYGINFVDAALWKIDQCYIVNSYKYGVFAGTATTTDAGEWSIVSSVFDEAVGSGQSAIRYETGGGGRILGTKILHHDIGVDLCVADGVATSVFLVNGCSIEGQGSDGWAIRLSNSGSGSFAKTVISGCQFNTTTQGILIAGTANANIPYVSVNGSVFNNSGVSIIHGSYVSVVGNIFVNGSTITYAVSDTAGSGTYVDGNMYRGFSSGAQTTGCYGVRENNGAMQKKNNGGSWASM